MPEVLRESAERSRHIIVLEFRQTTETFCKETCIYTVGPRTYVNYLVEPKRTLNLRILLCLNHSMKILDIILLPKYKGSKDQNQRYKYIRIRTKKQYFMMNY